MKSGNSRGIANEKHRRFIAGEIPIALLGVEFQRGTARVALRIGRSGLAGDGRETREHIGLGARLEDLGDRIFRDVAGDDQRAECAPTLGMDDTLGNPLAVLMRQLFEKLVIFEQHRAARTGGQAILIIGNGGAGKVVKVTSAGSPVLDHARRAVAADDDVLAAAARQCDPKGAPLRLGIIPTLAPYLMPLLLPLLRNKSPSLRLMIVEDLTGRIVEHVLHGELDAGEPIGIVDETTILAPGNGRICGLIRKGRAVIAEDRAKATPEISTQTKRFNTIAD